jgi:hypothetical protein
MATSQFRIFSASDVGAPVLNGLTGSLVNVLDAVLVNGYGGTSSLGWLKPLANDSLTSSLACWRQPSGSGLILFVNDAAPTGSTTAGGREAWAGGYESILGLTSSIFPSMGTGGGLFPTGSQIVPTFVPLSVGGHPTASLWWRKSATTDSASRYWILFGDSSTFYMFVQANDTFGVYYVMWFGDIYSFKPNDNYKCMIHGRCADASNTSTNRFDASDVLLLPTSIAFPVFFLPRKVNGDPGAQQINKVGDRAKNTLTNISTPGGSSENITEFAGICPALQPDNSIQLSPIWVCEPGPATIRGKMRGLYNLIHPSNAFHDGQVLIGGNEHIGKTFRCVKTGPTATPANGTVWVIETSNTVETN